MKDCECKSYTFDKERWKHDHEECANCGTLRGYHKKKGYYRDCEEFVEKEDD